MVAVAGVLSVFLTCVFVSDTVARPTDSNEDNSVEQPIQKLQISYSGDFSHYVTACPVKVSIDENANRHPAIIRQVSCDSGCQYCRQLSVDDTQFACVQVFSNFDVYYTDTKVKERLEGVPIDCRCMAYKGRPSKIIEPNLV